MSTHPHPEPPSLPAQGRSRQNPTAGPHTRPTAELGDTYDVVVVGARCAGAATALLLARGGLSVLVVDRSGYGADTLSTHALTKPSVLQLSRWGVLDELRRAGTPTVSRVVFRYGADQVEIPIKANGDVDGLYAPRRTNLDRVLVDEAVRSGATVRHLTPVRSLHCTGERVSGVVLETDTGTKTVRSRLVVGADGARSFVARAVGAPTEYRATASSATMYAYVPDLPRDAYLTSFRSNSAVGVIPTDGGLANVWAAVSMARFAREARTDVKAYFDHVLGMVEPDLAADVRQRWDRATLRSFPGLLGFARRPWGPGWALVGDAVYFKDPISAHGMTDALIGAELLARSVLAAFAGQDEAEALTGYARIRGALAAPMMPAVARLATYEWEPSDVQHAHLALNRAMKGEWEALSALGPLPGADVLRPSTAAA